MPRSRKTTGQYTGVDGYGYKGSDYGIYDNDRNFDRPENNRYMSASRSYGSTADYGRDNGDYGHGSSGVGVRYNQNGDIYGDRYTRNTGRRNQFSGHDGNEPEGHWLDRAALQRNRYYEPDDRSYSNRYGRGMYANPEEKYEDDEAEDIRDVRMDSNYSSNYDEIGHEGSEDIEDVDSNYDELYRRDDDRSSWRASTERNYDLDDYRR